MKLANSRRTKSISRLYTINSVIFDISIQCYHDTPEQEIEDSFWRQLHVVALDRFGLGRLTYVSGYLYEWK